MIKMKSRFFSILLLGSMCAGAFGCTEKTGAGTMKGSGETQIDHNRALITKFIDEGMNGKTPAAMDVLMATLAPDVVNHNAMAGKGREGTIQLLAAVGQSFPDLKASILDVFATEDRVVVRWNLKGTLTGQPFLGISANGQKIDFDAIDIWTVKNGQLYEHWDQLDWTRALVELGVKEIPAPFVAIAQQPIGR